MNYLVIPDKFKGSLTAHEVIQSISKGLNRADKFSSIDAIIASDGGDGFLDAVSSNLKANEITVETVNPLGDKIVAAYLLNTETKTAYIELAKASGLELLSQVNRSATATSTYGTGLQIKDAIKNGATKVYIGLGGSATNDAGIGIAAAMGYSFLDKNGQVLQPIGDNLARICNIHLDSTKAIGDNIQFYAVNDVDNPLFGPNGAAHIYAKQKGASPQDILDLDKGLEQFNAVVSHALKVNHALVPGAGAAGGTAYGLKTFLNAEFISGVHFLLELAEVPAILAHKKIDYIITGEGKIDEQTANGKLVKGVLDLAKEHNIPVVAICGKLEATSKELQKMGLENAIEIYNEKHSIAYSIKNAAELVENKIYQFFSKKLAATNKNN